MVSDVPCPTALFSDFQVLAVFSSIRDKQLIVNSGGYLACAIIFYHLRCDQGHYVLTGCLQLIHMPKVKVQDAILLITIVNSDHCDIYNRGVTLVFCSYMNEVFLI